MLRASPHPRKEIQKPSKKIGRRPRRSVEEGEAEPRLHSNHAAGAKHSERSLVLHMDAEQRLVKRAMKQMEWADMGWVRTPLKDGVNHVQ